MAQVNGASYNNGNPHGGNFRGGGFGNRGFSNDGQMSNGGRGFSNGGQGYSNGLQRSDGGGRGYSDGRQGSNGARGFSNGGRGSTYGRGSGGGGGRGGNYQVYNGRPRRNLEEEMLMLVNSEFQINCTDYRNFADILHRVQQNEEMWRFVHRDQENLKLFIKSYHQNFVFHEDRQVVQWRKDQRLAAKTDRKEAQREERRQWSKKYDMSADYYDPVLEQAVLRFVLALFDATGSSALKMDQVVKAIKILGKQEVDIDDYVGGDLRTGKFLLKRDYLFREHSEMLYFNGKTHADVVYRLNEHIREEAMQVDNRMPVVNLRRFYMQHETEETRDFMKMDDADKFVNFLDSVRWVFRVEGEGTHVVSRRALPELDWDQPLDNDETLAIVEQFKQVHRQEEKGDDGGGGGGGSSYYDDLEYALNGSTGRVRRGAPSRGSSSIADSVVASDNHNPFK